MPTTPKPQLTRSLVQGALVLTVLEPQLQGDRQITAFRHELDEAVAQSGAKHVVLDLRHVKALTSAVFRPLLSLRHHLEAGGGRLTLCHLTPVVAEVFQATRPLAGSRTSASTFEVQPTLAAAVASLNREPEEPAAPRLPGRAP
jgi:anti-anti-sigma factor